MHSQPSGPSGGKKSPRKRSCSPNITAEQLHDQKRQKKMPDTEISYEADRESAFVKQSDAEVDIMVGNNSVFPDQATGVEPDIKDEERQDGSTEEVPNKQPVHTNENKDERAEIVQRSNEEFDMNLKDRNAKRGDVKETYPIDVVLEIQAVSKDGSNEKQDTDDDKAADGQSLTTNNVPKHGNWEEVNTSANVLEKGAAYDKNLLALSEKDSSLITDDKADMEITENTLESVQQARLGSGELPSSGINNEDISAPELKNDRLELQTGLETTTKVGEDNGFDFELKQVQYSSAMAASIPTTGGNDALVEIGAMHALVSISGVVYGEESREVTTDVGKECPDENKFVQVHESPQSASSEHALQAPATTTLGETGIFTDRIYVGQEHTHRERTNEINQKIHLTQKESNADESSITSLPKNVEIYNKMLEQGEYVLFPSSSGNEDAIMQDINESTVYSTSKPPPSAQGNSQEENHEEIRQAEPAIDHVAENHRAALALQNSIEIGYSCNKATESTDPLPYAFSEAPKDGLVRRSTRIQKKVEAKAEMSGDELKAETDAEKQGRSVSKARKVNATAKTSQPKSRARATSAVPRSSTKESEKKQTLLICSKVGALPEKISASNGNTEGDAKPSDNSLQTVAPDKHTESYNNLDPFKIANSDFYSSIGQQLLGNNISHAATASNERQVTDIHDFSQSSSPRANRNAFDLQHNGQSVSQNPDKKQLWNSHKPIDDASMGRDESVDIPSPRAFREERPSSRPLEKFRMALRDLLHDKDQETLLSDAIDEIGPFISDAELIAMFCSRQFSNEVLEGMGLVNISEELSPPLDSPLHDLYVRDRELIRLSTPFVTMPNCHALKLRLRVPTRNENNYFGAKLTPTKQQVTLEKARSIVDSRGSHRLTCTGYIPRISEPGSHHINQNSEGHPEVISLDSDDDSDIGILSANRSSRLCRPQGSSDAPASSESRRTGEQRSQKSSPLNSQKSSSPTRSTSMRKPRYRPSTTSTNVKMRYQTPGIPGSGKPAIPNAMSSINPTESHTQLVHGLELDSYLNDLNAVHWSLAAKEIPHLLDRKSWGCTNVRHEEDSLRDFIQMHRQGATDGYDVMDGFPLVEDVQFVITRNGADPNGDCYWRALSMCLHGTTGAWDVVKAEHLGYLHYVLTRPRHPRHQLYRDSLNNKLFTVDSPAGVKFDANLWQLLHMPHAWTPAAMQQITADLYNVMLVTFSTHDNGDLYEVNTRGSYNSRHIFMLFTGGNHYCPMFPNEFMPWEFRYPRPTIESTAKYQFGPDPTTTARKKACQHSWRSDISKSVLPPVPRLHGCPVDKLRPFMSANRPNDW